ncbi:YcnI family protein [Streptomyces sp. CAU 1734]|uniref:YcnI family copper-binding membrane protein n=1 Tax=Streptomyces sp. CAU 1734 TaxID=3140360 RepID=UPI0032610C8F
MSVSHRFTRTAARATAVATVVAAGSLLLSGTALAHVSVQPQGEAAKGGYATVNFRVPNERDDASTVKLEVSLPTEHPMAIVMPQPVPGWKVVVTKTKPAKPLESHGRKITEVVSKVTWTADGSKVGPGQFQQFPLVMGSLPENTDQVVFKALQTYDNKEVVRWIEEPAKAGGTEPELPAPVLELSAPAADHHGSGEKADGKGAGEKDAGEKNGGHGDKKESASASDDSDTTARVLAVVGILTGVAGIAFGVLAGRRRTAA